MTRTHPSKANTMNLIIFLWRTLFPSDTFQFSVTLEQHGYQLNDIRNTYNFTICIPKTIPKATSNQKLDVFGNITSAKH